MSIIMAIGTMPTTSVDFACDAVCLRLAAEWAAYVLQAGAPLKAHIAQSQPIDRLPTRTTRDGLALEVSTTLPFHEVKYRGRTNSAQYHH